MRSMDCVVAVRPRRTAGGDPVDLDALAPELGGKGARRSREGVFRGGVGGHVGESEVAGRLRDGRVKAAASVGTVRDLRYRC
jgi:hypothetical protein